MRTTARRITSIAAATAAAAALTVGAAGTAGAQTAEQPAETDSVYGSLAAAGLSDEDGTLTPIGQSVTTPVVMGSAAAFFAVCFSVESTHIGNCPT